MRKEVVTGIELDSEWLPDEDRWEHSLIVPQYSIIVNFTSEEARSFGPKLRRRGLFDENHKEIAATYGPGIILDSKWIEDHWEHELEIPAFDATLVLFNEEARKVGGSLYRRGANRVELEPEHEIDAAIVERLLDGYTAREAGIPIGWKDVYIREFNSQGLNYREVCELLQISGATYRKALEQ
jgi:hypothetical protein